MMPPNALLAYARAFQIALLMFVQTFAWAGQTPQARPTAPTVGFTLRNIDQEWWLVAPDGQPFFSLGVCCVHQGLARDQFDPEAPAYAAWQHYENSQSWANATLKRLKRWASPPPAPGAIFTR